MDVLIFNVLIVSLYCFIIRIQLVSSDSTWFGQNKEYECHCERNRCDDDGYCLDNVKCQKNWFGPQCQYQDLTYMNVHLSSSIAYLTDRDDSTCNTDFSQKTIFLEWNDPIVFTWLRIVVSDANTLSQFTLQFQQSLNSQPVNCSNKRQFLMNNNALDIKCDLLEGIKRLEISGDGVSNLCSLYINGGRNMALKQPSTQSSTYTNQSASASLAVDGIINQKYNTEPNSCTLTDPAHKASSESWTVNIPLSQITRYVIYNRDDCCSERLNHFEILTYGDHLSRFSYKDARTLAQSVTTVLDKDKHTVSTVTIQVTGTDRILTLCEVQIYGECTPGTWGLSCDRTCSDRCLNKLCSLHNGKCNDGCIGRNLAITCQQGPWFGNDRYLCHCDVRSTCDLSGNCYKNRCEKGWFGYKCQYQDLATLDTAKIEISPSTDLNVLTDRDDVTCNRMKSNITITWNMKYPFSWIRLKLSDNRIPSEIILTFNAEKDAIRTDILCKNKNVIQNPDKTVDIRCDIDKPIKKLMITNAENVCSLYVNGGRNLALYQTAYQSTTYSDANNISYGADKAVDGNRNGNFKANTCSHTGDVSDPPTFYVTFPKALVYRVDIYNRVDSYSDRLSYSTLTLYNETTNTFSEKLGNVMNEALISIYPNFHTISTKVEFNTKYVAAFSWNKAYLTLCEVEVFGECAPGTYGLNCDKYCDPICYHKQCNKDTGECEACEPGKWGLKCQESCSQNCINQTCDSTIGTCNEGCIEGYRSVYCNESCNATMWERNCANTCNASCNNNQCNSITGECTERCLGYRDPPTCSLVCLNHTYGLNCNSSCSVNCDSGCDHINGHCNVCSPGYGGDQCNEACDEHHYGRNCLLNCSSQCHNQTCQRETGKCSQCICGYTGVFCNEKTNSLTNDNVKSTFFGIGFGAGMCSLIALQAIILVIIYFRRRMLLHNDRQNHQVPEYNKPNVLNRDDIHNYEDVRGQTDSHKQHYETVGETINI